MADSPSLRETLRASSALDLASPFILSSISRVCTLYPRPLMVLAGSSMVSSMVSILWASGNSNIRADSRELLPAPLAPHTMMDDLLSTRNDSRPADLAEMVPLPMRRVRVQGDAECFLIATESPFGLMG